MTMQRIAPLTHLSTSPTVKGRTLTDDEFMRLHTAAMQLDGSHYKGRVIDSLRDCAIMLLLLYTGIKVE
ncbi:MAG: hypothetical protein HC853_18035, partial [Anaerolineae bacterium]|nr:hypothetical protein [Anaerolineae bacterium]